MQSSIAGWNDHKQETALIMSKLPLHLHEFRRLLLQESTRISYYQKFHR